MSYFIANQNSTNSHNLLVGSQENHRIYLTIPFTKNLDTLLQDLSIKGNLNKFLNEVQDLTSLISFGLSPIGIQFNNDILPDYLRNLNIPKKISDIFGVEHLLLTNSNLR